MRIARSLFLLAALFIAPAFAQAGPIVAGDTVTLTDGPGNTGGGEFNMFVNGSAQSFITFCLQKTQFISFNQAYTVGSVTNYADDAGGNDPIESQTAWLYSSMVAGSLTGYTHNQASANMLQNAIWYFEKEHVLTANQISSNNFIQLANAAVAAGYSGIGNVRVVNLFRNGVAAQDQLILQVPGAAALTLLGPGLAALMFMRRRRTLPQA